MSRTPLITITLLGLLLGQGMASCSHSPGQRDVSREPSRTLEALTVTDMAEAVRVELAGTNALSYSLSTSVAPASATLDLPGVVSGPAIHRLTVKTPPLVEIIPDHVTHPREGMRVVFKLSAAAKPEIRAQGSRLLIDFPKVRATIDDGGRTEPAAVEVKAAGPQEGRSDASRQDATPPRVPAASLAAATVMSKIDVRKQSEDTLVVISGNGVLGYEVVPIGDDRLVVDLPNVTSDLPFHVLPVNHPLLKQIRIGQHSEKVRLVFDLLKPAAHAIHAKEETLSIGLQALTMAGPVRTDRATPDAGPRPTGPDPSLAQLVSTGTAEGTEDAMARRLRPRLAQMAPEAKGSGSRADIGARQYVGRRISMDFQQADITNVLRLIADVSGFNIVIGEGVKAKVTLKLASVPWDQALDMILKMNNLGMIKQGNIVWIDTLANIARMQDEEAKAKEAKAKAEELVTRVIYVQNVPASEILTTLRQYLSPRGQLQVNTASNSLVVKDTESQIGQFAELVRSLDLEVPQVSIEARIIQADTSYSRSLGVQWGFTQTEVTNSGRYYLFSNLTGPVNEPNQADNTDGTFANDFIVNLPAAVSGLAAAPAFGFATGKLNGNGPALDVRISAGELLGLTKVIAAPKISTLDKREAKIEQGESIPFQTTSLQGTQTTFVDANLTLQVTPQITSRDPKEIGKQILLKVRVTRNSVGARSNPAGPSIDKKEATTQVLVQDGETMVIGGIFIDQQRNSVAGMPWMDRVPVLGWLFKSKTEEVSKAELLIFLTPTIVKT